MSVLQLRRDMVVADEPVVEIDAPLPLRTFDRHPDDIDADEIELVEEHEDDGRFGKLKFLAIGAAVLALVGAYPAAMVAASDVGDRIGGESVDRTSWTAPWAGAAATALKHQYEDLGWAQDAPGWSPMAQLVGKPAFQGALADAIGQYVSLAAAASGDAGEADPDLGAAARLIGASSSASQLRAAYESLTSYDRRMRRSASVTASSLPPSKTFGVVDEWAAQSQSELGATAAFVGGSPIDESATVAVYAAKGRALAAHMFIEAMPWPETPQAGAARNAALAAWEKAAEFHPMFVFNGSMDSALAGNHPATMGFLVTQARQSTRTLEEALEAEAAALAAKAAARAAATAAAAEDAAVEG